MVSERKKFNDQTMNDCRASSAITDRSCSICHSLLHYFHFNFLSILTAKMKCAQILPQFINILNKSSHRFENIQFNRNFQFVWFQSELVYGGNRFNNSPSLQLCIFAVEINSNPSLRHSLIDGAVKHHQSSPCIATTIETADKQIMTAQRFSIEPRTN